MSNEQPTSPLKDRQNKLFISTVVDKQPEKPTTEAQPKENSPAEGQLSDSAKRMKETIGNLAKQYEICPDVANHIQVLEDFEIVILCDDSGSMSIPIQGTSTTRWDECRQLVNIIVDIYAAFDSNGVDVYFLNRPPLLNVTDIKKVHESFTKPPDGLTPMVPTLRSILQAKAMDKSTKQKILILIVTDGVPTNPAGALDIETLEQVLRKERTAATYVTFLACTDEPAALDYLNNWDRTMENVDVIDDYRSEAAQIQEKQGKNAVFSYGDYLMKALIGSIVSATDKLDE